MVEICLVMVGVVIGLVTASIGGLRLLIGTLRTVTDPNDGQRYFFLELNNVTPSDIRKKKYVLLRVDKDVRHSQN